MISEEMQKKLQQRKDQYDAFVLVRTKLSSLAGLRTALTKAGFTYDDIECALDVVKESTKWMSSRAK